MDLLGCLDLLDLSRRLDPEGLLCLLGDDERQESKKKKPKTHTNTPKKRKNPAERSPPVRREWRNDETEERKCFCLPRVLQGDEKERKKKTRGARGPDVTESKTRQEVGVIEEEGEERVGCFPQAEMCL